MTVFNREVKRHKRDARVECAQLVKICWNLWRSVIDKNNVTLRYWGYLHISFDECEQSSRLFYALQQFPTNMQLSALFSGQ